MTNYLYSHYSNDLFKNIPEFNSGTKTYDVLDFPYAAGSPSFGTLSNTLELSMSTYDFITSLSVQIELPALTSQNRESAGPGYITYVNNVGHAIIDSLELKIGTETLIQEGFPYSKWLDIHNELTDIDDNINIAIGKKEHNAMNDIYQNTPLTVNIPLHIFMSDFIRNAFPAFMIDSSNDANIKIKIKLKSLSKIINYYPASHYTNNYITTTAQPSNVRLILGYFNINDTELKNNLKNQTYISYFNDYNYSKQLSNNLSSEYTFNTNRDYPIKELEFVLIQKERDTESTDIPDPEVDDGTIQINKDEIDKHKNDIFNYSNTTLINGNFDTFGDLQFKLDNSDFFLNRVPSNVLRTIMAHDNNPRIPKKFIYPISFTPKPYSGELFGCLDVEQIDDLKLQFDSVPADFNLYVFITHIRKMTIKSGNLQFDDWSTAELGHRRTGFRFGQSHLNGESKAIKEQTTKEEEEQKQTVSIVRLGKSTSLKSQFLLIESDISEGVLTVVLGNDMNSLVMDSLNLNLRKGSLMSLNNPDIVSQIKSIELINNYYEPIPSHLKNVIKKSISVKLDMGDDRSLENLFETILPYSKAFFIRIDETLYGFDYWLYNDGIKKTVQDIEIYVDSLYFFNKIFNNRVYKITLGNSISIKEPLPYKRKDAYLIMLNEDNINVLKWTNFIPDISHITVIPVEMESLIADLTEIEIINQCCYRINLNETNTLYHDEIKDNMVDAYKNKLLPRLLAEAKKNVNNPGYKNYYERLLKARDIANNKFNKSALNTFKIFSNTNANIFIDGVETIEREPKSIVNTYLSERVLNNIIIVPEQHKVIFNFFLKN